MLLELQIQDFALIDKIKLSFSDGLNILTGETGAGKSIIIDSVNFVLGERSSKDVIRTGVEKTTVEAVFENTGSPELVKTMESYGIDIDDGVIIFSRELYQTGRSVCRINGKIVTTSVLKLVGNYLIDIHGQHEHQSLLNEENHINILDMFGGHKLCDLREQVKQAYNNVLEIKNKLSLITGNDRERERKLDLLGFQIREIDDAKLRIGEEEELLKQRTILKNSNKLYTVLSSTYGGLFESSDSPSVYDRLGYILSELHSIINLDEKLNSIYKCIEESYYLLEGATADIREYRDKIDFSPELLDDVELRLDTINKLKRKYGSTTKDILDFRESANLELQEILSSEDRIKELQNSLSEALDILKSKSKSLSSLRKSIAEKLEKDIVNELKRLGMDKSKFVINFEMLEKDGHVNFNEKGMDIIRFLISTNLGEPEKPLSKVASGGEISRIMLAIKAVLADSDEISTLIFDEIDTGISGKAAQAVAEKLGQISKNHQVICVTHLPQIASMADIHFFIQKQPVNEKTFVNIDRLGNESQVNEIARMLGGVTLTELTIKHAEEMIKMAQSLKTDMRV